MVQARVEAVALVEQDPMLAERPALRQAVLDVLDAERAQFLEKA